MSARRPEDQDAVRPAPPGEPMLAIDIAETRAELAETVAELARRADLPARLRTAARDGRLAGELRASAVAHWRLLAGLLGAVALLLVRHRLRSRHRG